jgi:urease accessory protein
MLALTMNFFKKNLFLIFFLISFPAFAHHPMGGELPQNFLNGILSGIAHPIIGFDHLAFILTFGIITSYFKNKVILPLYFVTFSLIGTIVSVNFLVVPFSELIISLSIIIAGLTSLYEKKINIYFPIILALGGGFFHGYAFGQSVVGIEASP